MTRPDLPDIIKYFYEEPASLETLSSDDDADARRRDSPLTLEGFLNSRRYFRGYLAGSSLARGTVGLTSLARHGLLLDLLMELRAGRPVSIWTAESSEPERDDRLLIDRPSDVLVAVLGDAPLDLSTVTALAAQQRRQALGFLQGILNQGMPVLFPEPAHDGYDWSIFSPFPLLQPVSRVLESAASPEARVFAIPHVRARSEEKFYFERYDLSLFAEYELGTR